jgi:hypothetical protein
MADAETARRVVHSAESPPPEAGRGFGLTSATAPIVGSIIGVGIFSLATSLAAYGPISPISMALTRVGALALLFASHSRRLPADGSPYAYARLECCRLCQCLVLLDHRMGRERHNCRRLGAVGRGLHQQGPERADLGGRGTGRALGPGGHQPLRREERGLCAGRDDDPQVLRARFMSTVGLIFIAGRSTSRGT